MSPAEYLSEREARDLTQAGLAALLGVSRVTIARRETGTRPITREAELALLALPKTKRPRRPANVAVTDADLPDSQSQTRQHRRSV